MSAGSSLSSCFGGTATECRCLINVVDLGKLSFFPKVPLPPPTIVFLLSSSYLAMEGDTVVVIFIGLARWLNFVVIVALLPPGLL